MGLSAYAERASHLKNAQNLQELNSFGTFKLASVAATDCSRHGLVVYEFDFAGSRRKAHGWSCGVGCDKLIKVGSTQELIISSKDLLLLDCADPTHQRIRPSTQDYYNSIAITIVLAIWLVRFYPLLFAGARSK